MAEKCRATSWRTAFCHPPEKRFLRGAAHSGVFAVRRLAFFAAFWSAVNRGLRPRKLMYFLTAKSTKNSPADAFAYFVPANVRNGRLFAGLQANRPRFLPLLAGTSFHSFGIGPESFAAFRGGKDASGTNRKHRSLRSPLEAVLNRRIIVRSGKKEHSPARVPGAGGCKGLILLRPLNAGRRRLPRRTTCGWFWCYLLPSKGSYAPRAKTAALLLFAAKKYKSTPRLPQKRRLLKKPPENTQYYLIYGVVRNCIAASRSRGWRVPCRSTCPCANRRGTRRPPCSAG